MPGARLGRHPKCGDSATSPPKIETLLYSCHSGDVERSARDSSSAITKSARRRACQAAEGWGSEALRRTVLSVVCRIRASYSKGDLAGPLYQAPGRCPLLVGDRKDSSVSVGLQPDPPIEAVEAELIRL